MGKGTGRDSGGGVRPARVGALVRLQRRLAQVPAVISVPSLRRGGVLSARRKRLVMLPAAVGAASGERRAKAGRVTFWLGAGKPRRVYQRGGRSWPFCFLACVSSPARGVGSQAARRQYRGNGLARHGGAMGSISKAACSGLSRRGGWLVQYAAVCCTVALHLVFSFRLILLLPCPGGSSWTITKRIGFRVR